MRAGITTFRASWFARVVVAWSLGLSLCVVLALLLIHALVEQLLAQRADAALENDIASFEEIYAQRLVPGLREAVERRATDRSTNTAVLLMGRDGETLAGDGPATLRALAPIAGRIELSGERVYLAQTRELRGGFRLAVAHDVTADRAMMRALALALCGLGLGLVAASLIGGYALGRATKTRVTQLDSVLRKVETGDLDARYAPTARGDEFDAIGLALNRTLDRLSATTKGLKEVSDRVAHEMRTPLAHLRTGLDALLRKANGADRQPIGALVAETDELIAVFSALLDIATTEAAASDPRGLAPLAIDAAIDDVLELYDAVAEERAVQLSFQQRCGASIAGDRPLIVRMIANIIDNAIKFSPVGGVVSIATQTIGDDVSISIRDHGAGLAQNFEGRAFERFSRGPGAEATPGYGLGLALVRAIAMRHGMKIELIDAAPGLEVVMRGRMVAR